MKNIILILVAAITLNVFADYGSTGRSANKKYDGTAENLEKQYINVLNKEGSAISAGMVVVWDPANDDGASVIIDATAGGNPACIMVASCAANAFCKCQTYGYVSALLFESTGGRVASAGGKIWMSENNAGYVMAELAANQGAGDTPIGFFYDTGTAASASVEAFIRLR